MEFGCPCALDNWNQVGHLSSRFVIEVQNKRRGYGGMRWEIYQKRKDLNDASRIGAVGSRQGEALVLLRALKR